MSITIIPTPLAQAHAAAARAADAARNPRNAATCGVFDIAGRLGQAHRTEPFLVKTLNGLVDQDGFPAPFPLVRGGTVVKSVRADSRWPVAAVDAWFDDRLPPTARGAVQAVEQVKVAATLDARASMLFSGDAA